MLGLEHELGTLMKAAQQGDEAAYRRLLRGSVSTIEAAARRCGVSDSLVDDVVQDVLLTLHRARASYDPAQPFLPWLRAIARYRAVDLLRRHGRSTRRELHVPLAYDAAPSVEDNIEERLDWTTRAEPLAAAIAALPDGQRDALERLALREQTLADASAETGRSKVSLKVNLHRAIRSLRKTIGRTDTKTGAQANDCRVNPGRPKDDEETGDVG